MLPASRQMDVGSIPKIERITMAIPKVKVLKHLRGDIKSFKHEADEDRELIKDIKKKPKKVHHKKRSTKKHAKKGDGKIEKVMHEFKEGALHSGSKKGPKVKNRKQAIAIAMSEARRSKKK